MQDEVIIFLYFVIILIGTYGLSNAFTYFLFNILDSLEVKYQSKVKKTVKWNFFGLIFTIVIIGPTLLSAVQRIDLIMKQL